MRRRVRAWALWWIALWWLWMLLVGEWNRIEWIAAACAATVGASVAETARAVAGIRLPLPLRLIARAGTALGMVFVDFALLAVALVRRRQGAYVARDLAPGGAGEAAWAAYLATISPNAYVVDVDPERRTALLHDLVPNRSSESPI